MGETNTTQGNKEESNDGRCDQEKLGCEWEQVELSRRLF